MASSAQTTTTYGASPAAAYAGQLADEGDRRIVSAAASATTTAGQLVIRGSADGICRPLATGDTPVDDDDAIVASGVATATTAQIITSASLNGVTGATAFWPPRNVTLTVSSHANWDLTTIVVEGLGAFGEPVVESFVVPDAGNVVLTGTVIFSQVVQLRIPVQAGTSGTLKVGTGVKIGPINRKVYGVALYDATREAGAYAQYENVSIVRQGRIYVTAEGAVTKGDPVFVRFVVAGSEVYGGLSNAPDSTDCGLLEGARWGSTLTATGIAILELNLPS